MSSDENKIDRELEDADLIDYESLMNQDDTPLFFSLVVKPGEENGLTQPQIPGFIIHITNACFGVDMQKGTRTVVLCKPNEDEEIPICVLTPQHQNHSLDLLFNEGSSFVVKGNKVSSVTLTGYCQPNITPQIDAGMEDELNEQEIAELYKQRMGEADSDEAPELLNAEPEEINGCDIDDEVTTEPAPVVVEQPVSEPPTKRRKMNKSKSAVAASTSATVETPVAAAAAAASPEKADKKKKDKKKKKKKEKGLRTMKGGIQWRDMKEGTGADAKDGQTVSVYYVGQLDDKTVFDKTITGDGFSFVLGANEVIKGWDIGVRGMKVGAKRKLVIPPKMGYGKNGSPPKIPANSKLTFTVELKSIK